MYNYMNLSQQAIENFEVMGIQFKESGKEKEALDNLYMCIDCMRTYEYCDCDKKIKKLISYSEEIKSLTSAYRWGLSWKPSKIRNQFLKDMSDLIKFYQTEII